MENLKLSYYTIPVKLEDEENKYLLMHGYTGAIDIVSEEMLHKIMSVDTNALSADAIKFLLKRGYFTYQNEMEEFSHVARLANALQKKI